MSTGETNKLGKYEIIREIGRSNDVVYEAIDPSIGRRLALKELLMPDKSKGAQRRERIERFRREGKAAGRLTHPNIVTVYDVGVENDRYYIAMELLQGQSLRDALKARGMLPINDAVTYTTQLCEALSYAHNQGVIHRDIKPDNVHILPGNHIKLTDFGIARLAGESNLTQDGQIFGTPSYMSPEQISGKPLDARSDIFSVGVMLFEMLAGKKPFTGDSVVAITYAIMNSEPDYPAGIPPYIVSTLKKALAKNPDDRYADIEEMATDLREQRIGDDQAQPTPPQPSTGTPAPQPGAQTGYNQTSQVPSGKYIPSKLGWTPYGTPMPTADPDNSSTADPSATGSSRITVPPPVISAQTRSFLGLLLLILGLIGIVGFFSWSVHELYVNAREARSMETATKYFQQADELMQRENYEGAIKQYKLVIEKSPDSRMRMEAEMYLYRATVLLGEQAVNRGNANALLDVSERLHNLRPNSPEGYYFLGIYYERTQQYKQAGECFVRASRNLSASSSEQFSQRIRRKLQEYLPRFEEALPPQEAPEYIPPQ